MAAVVNPLWLFSRHPILIVRFSLGMMNGFIIGRRSFIAHSLGFSQPYKELPLIYSAVHLLLVVNYVCVCERWDILFGFNNSGLVATIITDIEHSEWWFSISAACCIFFSLMSRLLNKMLYLNVYAKCHDLFLTLRNQTASRCSQTLFMQHFS